LFIGFHFNIEQSGGASVLTKQATNFAFHLLHVAVLFLAASLHFGQTLCDLLFKAFDNRFIFLAAISTAAEDKGLFISFWGLTDLDLDTFVNGVPVFFEELLLELL
jgi:hypothetical protein